MERPRPGAIGRIRGPSSVASRNDRQALALLGHLAPELQRSAGRKAVDLCSRGSDYQESSELMRAPGRRRFALGLSLCFEPGGFFGTSRKSGATGRAGFSPKLAKSPSQGFHRNRGKFSAAEVYDFVAGKALPGFLPKSEKTSRPAPLRSCGPAGIFAPQRSAPCRNVSRQARPAFIAPSRALRSHVNKSSGARGLGLWGIQWFRCSSRARMSAGYSWVSHQSFQQRL